MMMIVAKTIACHLSIHEKTQWWIQSIERCRHTLYIRDCIDTFYALQCSLLHIYRKIDLFILFFSLFTEGLVQHVNKRLLPQFFCQVTKISHYVALNPAKLSRNLYF